MGEDKAIELLKMHIEQCDTRARDAKEEFSFLRRDISNLYRRQEALRKEHAEAWAGFMRKIIAVLWAVVVALVVFVGFLVKNSALIVELLNASQ